MKKELEKRADAWRIVGYPELELNPVVKIELDKYRNLLTIWNDVEKRIGEVEKCIFLPKHPHQDNIRWIAEGAKLAWSDVCAAPSFAKNAGTPIRKFVKLVLNGIGLAVSDAAIVDHLLDRVGGGGIGANRPKKHQ